MANQCGETIVRIAWHVFANAREKLSNTEKSVQASQDIHVQKTYRERRDFKMILNAKNGCLKIDDTDMYYISFGKGEKTLVMIPGLGDGLTTVKGMAIPFSIMYRKFAKDYKVYVFSIKNKLEEGYSTRDMARDVMKAMRKLRIKKAHIMGVSQGGMISQHLAIHYPEFVDKLILCVTIGKQNPTIQRVVSYWYRLAKRGNYRKIMTDTAKRMYVNYNENVYKVLVPILELFSAPKTFDRFLVQAKACLTHDTFDDLHKIQAKTLVIGAGKDAVLDGQASVEIAGQIKNSRLVMFEDYSHGVYEEAKEFNQVVLDFLKE